LRIPDESSGLGFDLEFGDALTLSGGYLSPTDVASDPSETNGLSTVHSAFANLVFDVNDRFKLGLSYIHSYFPVMMSHREYSSGCAGALRRSCDYRQFLWSASELPVQPWPDSFGWAGYTNAILENGAALAEASTGDNAEIWNYAAGLALPDFGKEGNLLGLVAGVPPRAGRNDFGARRDDDTSIHLEGFYRYQLTDNIAITRVYS